MSALRRHPVASFFVLAIAVTWGLDLASTHLALAGGTTGPGVVALVSGAGPSLAGLVMAWAVGGRRGVGDLVRRMLTWRRPLRWYALVLLLFPALLVGLQAAALTLSGQPFTSSYPGPWWLVPAFLLPVLVVGGPLSEELGWRGFALPTLLQRHGWLPAGVIIGLVWALWHRTPSSWGDVRIEPLPLLGLVLGAVVPDVTLSVLMAWVFVRTRGSALLAGLGMHTAANFALFLPAAPTGPESDTARWAVTLTFAGVMIVLAVLAARAGPGQRPVQGRSAPADAPGPAADRSEQRTVDRTRLSRKD